MISLIKEIIALIAEKMRERRERKERERKEKVKRAEIDALNMRIAQENAQRKATEAAHIMGAAKREMESKQ